MDRTAASGPQRPSRLRFWLGLLWFASSFGALYFARELSSFTLFGWPLGYWLAAQGCMLGFFAIAAGYAAAQNRLESGAGDATTRADD